MEIILSIFAAIVAGLYGLFRREQVKNDKLEYEVIKTKSELADSDLRHESKNIDDKINKVKEEIGKSTDLTTKEAEDYWNKK